MCKETRVFLKQFSHGLASESRRRVPSDDSTLVPPAPQGLEPAYKLFMVVKLWSLAFSPSLSTYDPLHCPIQKLSQAYLQSKQLRRHFLALYWERLTPLGHVPTTENLILITLLLKFYVLLTVDLDKYL
jgi:hypothetical protein